LIRPLGFTLEDKQLVRAGLDYHEFAALHVHDNLQECLAAFDPARIFALTTKGSQPFHAIRYQTGTRFCSDRKAAVCLLKRWINSIPDVVCAADAAAQPQLEFI